MNTHQRTSRRGGILFEVLLAIAVFAGAASFVLGAVSSAVDAQQRSLAEQQAVDLAASLLAELEIGTLNITDLREGLPRALGSIENYREAIDEQTDSGVPGWGVDINTQRTEYAGLTLVSLTVFQVSADAATGDRPEDAAVRYTLQQLMKLRDEEAVGYEEDEMLEGLPTEPDAGGSQ